MNLARLKKKIKRFTDMFSRDNYQDTLEGKYEHAHHKLYESKGKMGPLLNHHYQFPVYNTQIEKQEAETRKYQRHLNRLDKVRKGKWYGLEGKTLVTTAIIGIVSGLFFLSANITGNVIGLNQTSSNWVGGVLFLIGLVGAFVYLKRR